MILLRELTDFPTRLRGCAVAVGNFDGVHQGHAAIIRTLQSMADHVAGSVVVLSFDPHPATILRPDRAPPPLTWTERKAELLGELGVDALVAYPTSRDLLRLTASEFFSRILLDGLGAKAIVEGTNFRFGRHREGDVDLLRKLCDDAEVSLRIVEPIQNGDQPLSSSLVREMIANGKVAEAAKSLSRPYRIRGTVVPGARRGRELGFPTANLSGVDTLLPMEGVYAGAAYVGDKKWPAAINVGTNPTFKEERDKVEANLIGFSGDLYGQSLELEFSQRTREIRRFDSPDELIAQLNRDIASAEKAF